MSGFFQEGSVLLPLLSAEQHFLWGYKVPDQSPVLLSEQTFLINLKSLITPFFNKGSGVTFFLSSKLIDSNMAGWCFAANTWEQPLLKQTTLQWAGIQSRKGLWTNRDEQGSPKLSFLRGSFFFFLWNSVTPVHLMWWMEWLCQKALNQTGKPTHHFRRKLFFKLFLFFPLSPVSTQHRNGWRDKF